MNSFTKVLKDHIWCVLIMVGIILLFVGSIAFVSKENEVVSHLSFAGSIVSILLGAVVIVCSFVQNNSYQTKIGDISSLILLIKDRTEGIHKNVGSLESLIKGGQSQNKEENDFKKRYSISEAQKLIALIKVNGGDVFPKRREVIANHFLRLEDDKVRADTFLDFLTIVDLYRDYDRLFHIIYGSQLKILETLGLQGACPKEAIKLQYNFAVATYPKMYENYSYENYLGFLKEKELITEQNGTLSITEYGKQFLQYLKEYAIADPKNRIG